MKRGLLLVALTALLALAAVAEDPNQVNVGYPSGNGFTGFQKGAGVPLFMGNVEDGLAVNLSPEMTLLHMHVPKSSGAFLSEGSRTVPDAVSGYVPEAMEAASAPDDGYAWTYTSRRDEARDVVALLEIEASKKTKNKYTVKPKKLSKKQIKQLKKMANQAGWVRRHKKTGAAKWKAKAKKAMSRVDKMRADYATTLLKKLLKTQDVEKINVTSVWGLQTVGKKVIQAAIDNIKVQRLMEKEKLRKKMYAKWDRQHHRLNKAPYLPVYHSKVTVDDLEVKDLLHVHNHAKGVKHNSKKGNPGGSIAVNGVRQWANSFHDDFTFDAQGWSIVNKNPKKASYTKEMDGKRSTCGGSSDVFLGGYCSLSHHEVTKTYKNIPPHNMVKVTARVHFFDYWDGENLFVKVNDQVVFQESHFYCAKAFSKLCFGINVCGDSAYTDTLSKYIEFTIPHTGSDLRLTFGSSLTKKPCVASYGIDDVALHIKY